MNTMIKSIAITQGENTLLLDAGFLRSMVSTSFGSGRALGLQLPWVADEVSFTFNSAADSREFLENTQGKTVVVEVVMSDHQPFNHVYRFSGTVRAVLMTPSDVLAPKGSAPPEPSVALFCSVHIGLSAE